MYRQVRNRLDGFLELNSWCKSHSCTVYFGFNTIDDISIWICRVLFWLRLAESATFGDGQHSWMTLVRVSCLVCQKWAMSGKSQIHANRSWSSDLANLMLELVLEITCDILLSHRHRSNSASGQGSVPHLELHRRPCSIQSLAGKL